MTSSASPPRSRIQPASTLALGAALVVLAACDAAGPCEGESGPTLALEVKFVDDGGSRLPTQDFLGRISGTTVTVCRTADGDPRCETQSPDEATIDEDRSSFELWAFPTTFEDRRDCRIEVVRVTIDAPDCDPATFELPGGVAMSTPIVERSMLVACSPRAP